MELNQDEQTALLTRILNENDDNLVENSTIQLELLRKLAEVNKTQIRDEDRGGFRGQPVQPWLTLKIAQIALCFPSIKADLVINHHKNVYFLFSASVNEDTKRVKMFLTTSQFAPKNYGEALVQLKERLGLPSPDGNEDSLGFLRNTCMEPYQASEEYVTYLGDVFRETVLNCIGAVSFVL